MLFVQHIPEGWIAAGPHTFERALLHPALYLLGKLKTVVFSEAFKDTFHQHAYRGVVHLLFNREDPHTILF